MLAFPCDPGCVDCPYWLKVEFERGNVVYCVIVNETQCTEMV